MGDELFVEPVVMLDEVVVFVKMFVQGLQTQDQRLMERVVELQK